MESILTDIIKSSAVLTSLKEVFIDVLDLYAIIFILLFCISFIYKNFDLKNEKLNTLISKAHNYRNFVYLCLIANFLFLTFLDKIGLQSYVVSNLSVDIYFLLISGSSSLYLLLLKKQFKPKEDKTKATQH